MKPITSAHFTLASLLLMTATGLGGCQSLATVMTQVDLEMSVEAEGPGAPAESNVFSVTSAPRFPYEHRAYRDEFLEWAIQVPMTGFSIDFINHSEHSIELRWDQSTWSSSLHPAPIPMLVRGFSTGFRFDGQTFIDLDSDESAAQPIALTVESDASLRVNIAPERFPIFPEGDLFGIQRVEKGQGFIDDGIGRWLELELPVEMEDRQWSYRIRLTVRDIAQWNSYH